MDESTKIAFEKADKLREIGDGYKKLADGFSKVADFYANPDENTKQYADCEKAKETFALVSKRLLAVAEEHYKTAENIEGAA